MIKLSLLSAFILLYTVTSFAQEKGDIGFIYSNDNMNKLGLEYRDPMGEKYKLKIGFTTGSYFSFDRSTIISASDSTVVHRNKHSRIKQYSVRIGVERQLKESIFSVGLGLQLSYSNENTFEYNSISLLTENGNWVSGHYVKSLPISEQDNGVVKYVIGDNYYSTLNRRYLVPGLRLSVNMDKPLGNYFLLHLSAASILNVPFYIDEIAIENPAFPFPNANPTLAYIDLMANIGIRYKIGSFKRKNKR